MVKLLCDLCGEGESGGERMARHLAKVHGQRGLFERRRCEHCPYSTSKGPGDVLDHFLRNHADLSRPHWRRLRDGTRRPAPPSRPSKAGQHSCDDCGPEVTFRFRVSLNTHFRRKHFAAAAEKVCDVCLRSSINWDLYQHHVMNHANLEGLAMRRALADLRQRKRLSRSRAKPASCSQCPAKYKCAEKLRSHKRSLHMQPFEPRSSSLSCDECGKNFPKGKIFQLHLLLDHPSGVNVANFKPVNKYARRPIATQERCYACDVCDYKTVAKLGCLAVHLDKVHGLTEATRKPSPPLVCDLCAKELPVRDLFASHFRNRHMAGMKAEKPWRAKPKTCDNCSVTFASPVTFASHLFRTLSSPCLIRSH